MLYLINVFGNIVFIDIFLGYEFTKYGINVLKFVNDDPETRTDPMVRVFPRVTKCTFNTYGPSGTIQTHDAMCVLPINIVNEKIYVFLWFWLLLLCVLTIMDMLYQIFTMLNPAVIRFHLRMRLRKETTKRYSTLLKLRYSVVRFCHIYFFLISKRPTITLYIKSLCMH